MKNLLANEDSFYLKAHANDLVNWYPWGDEAIQLAKKTKKVIFLSIGYSSCHWCHVMQEESFKNRDIADILNSKFISIKVDKEERPDIDKHFQEVFAKMNNTTGGWPLSIFLTPTLVPIYSATYIPPLPDYGKMGFKDLLEVIANNWEKSAKSIESKGYEILDAIRPKGKITATKLNDSLIDIAINQIKQVYDKTHGGFGKAPKFPHTSTLELAINLYKLSSDNELKDIVINSLDKISLGGMYDIVDGGFCRYSTDNLWLVPHFEKMTYDNALLLGIYTKAFKEFKIDRYKKIALETAEFLLDKMNQDLLFFSSVDADSNGIEGDYYIYDYNEVKEAFERESIDKSLLFELSITRNGNFDGKSIARYIDLSIRDKDEAKRAIKVLKDIRAKREYPFIDKKIITSWNAMVVISLFELSYIDKKYKDIALKSLNKLKSKMFKDNRLFHSTLYEKEPKIEAFLEDYAYYIKALITAYNYTFDEIFLIEATNLTNEAIKLFYKNGRWQIGNLEFKNFIDDFDSSYPSPLSIMVENLLTIRSLSESIYEKFANFTLQVQSYNLMRQPISRPKLSDVAIRYLKDDKIVKANIKNLEKIRNMDTKYPYIQYKLINNSSIEICNNSKCFATLNSLDNIKEYL